LAVLCDIKGLRIKKSGNCSTNRLYHMNIAATASAAIRVVELEAEI